MSVSETIKVNILIDKKSKDGVLKFLQENALMQIEDDVDENAELNAELTLNDVETGAERYDYDLAGVKFALDFLTPFDETKVPLGEKLAGNKIKLSQEELEKIVKNYDYKKIVEKCQDLEAKINEEKSKLQKLETDKETLEPWRSLKIAPQEAETGLTKTIWAKVDEQKYLDFLKALEKESKEVVIEKIHVEEKSLYIAITFAKDVEAGINKVINEFGLEIVELPYSDMLPRKALELTKAQKHENTKAIEGLRQEARGLTNEMNPALQGGGVKNLKIVFDWLTWEAAKQEGDNKLLRTNYTAMITGWIEKMNLKILHNKLQKITKNNVEIEEVKLNEEDKAKHPVVIRNKKFWRPFESVTGIYGLPKADETDPTVFLAPFFIIFFGLCLTDAGYGILLAAIAYAAIKIMKVPRENQKLFRVLIYGGIVTFVLGALFGGWFGITLDNLPESGIKNALLGIRQIDPVKSPLIVLGLTFVLGIIQVWTGILIGMYWKFRQKDYKEGILEHGVWLYFIPAVLFWALTKMGVLAESLMGLANILLLAGVIILIATQGRKQKNIVAKIGAGIMSLYGLVGYLSDVLSYSRLLALGLATGIIAMVINLIAFLFKDMIPYGGWIIAIVILVGGHLFNLVINVLGAFIHSGRLQFVEFFPKFMEGGGVRFKPLCRESKYVVINKG